MGKKDLDVAIYKTKDKEIELQVQLDKDTVWLDRKSISTLFGVNVPAISKHITNIFDDKELSPRQTVSKMEMVQKEGNRDVKREIEVFNLDMIISVGYRVNSSRATQFRIWATNILRNYIVNGYAVNQKRLKEEAHKFKVLQSHIKTLRNVVDKEQFTLDQSKELVKIISDYSDGLELIDEVDKERVKLPRNLSKKKVVAIEYEKAVSDITQLRIRTKASELFGNERGQGLKSCLSAIFQTYQKKDLYPSFEEKAANLLYLVIKDHPFTDGNKRIGSFLFVRFLGLNGRLYGDDGSKRISENALVAIALLIAQSVSKDKDIMVKLVVNMIAEV